MQEDSLVQTREMAEASTRLVFRHFWRPYRFSLLYGCLLRIQCNRGTEVLSADDCLKYVVSTLGLPVPLVNKEPLLLCNMFYVICSQESF